MVFSRKTAFVWSLSVIIFALSATARDVSGLSTKQNSLDTSSLEAPSATKTDEVLSEKPLQQDTECDCGPNGDCSIDFFGRRVCHCRNHFVEKDGYCAECDCGYFGECEFNDEGEKTCNCVKGYEDKAGECTPCLCWLNYYTLINCTFTNGITKCLCPAGYQDEGSSCRDINECLNRSACPETTNCMNTEGNYTCTCKDGYSPWSDQHDTKRYGCREVNECLEKNACPFRDTSDCINTQGSYYCKCKEGYSILLSQYTIETEGCEEDQSGWKLGYIVLFSFFVIASILLSIVIIKKRSSS